MNKKLSSASASILLFITLATSACSNNIDKSEQSKVDPTSQPISMPVPTNSSTDSPTDSSTESTEKIQFACGSSYNAQLDKKVPTTIAWKSEDRRAIVQWTKPMSNYWSPEKRCEQVSTQMNQAFQADNVKFLTNGKMNGQNVICTATEVRGDCQNLLMTLRSEDKPLLFLDELRNTLNGKSSEPNIHTSDGVQMYFKIDLQAMWKNAPSAK